MAPHRIHLEPEGLRDRSVSGRPADDHDLSPLTPGGEVLIEGDEAKHAVRVKRLSEGAPVEVLDGLGSIASASVARTEKQGKAGWVLTLRVDSVRMVEPTRPELDVWSAPPKGERLERMIDQLAQAGVASWTPLDADRTVVHPRDGKLGRLERVAGEASKQCGRAWRLAIRPSCGMAEALRGGSEDGPTLVVADASGTPYEPSGAGRIRLLVGPEGGWTPAELDRARHAGATVVSFGVHVMRIETACVVAAGVIMSGESAGSSASAAGPASEAGSER